MLTPYPDIAPYKTDTLAVDSTHNLALMETGNPEGLPVFILHDGPGCGSDPYHRRLLDAERFRIIQYDQRGCGRSTPHAELSDDYSAQSLSDLSRIVEACGVESGLFLGFGYGARLAAEFAARRPDRVDALVLCGFGFAESECVDWLIHSGAPSLFPDYWQELLAKLDLGHGGCLLEELQQHLNNSNELDRLQAAKAWSRWLARISTLHCHQDLIEEYSHPHTAIALAKLSVAEMLHLKTARRALPSISETVNTVVVHGRYDAVSPLVFGQRLKQANPAAELFIVRDSGHSCHDPAMTDALLKIISQVADDLEGYGRLNG